MAHYHDVIRISQDGAIRTTLALLPLLKKAARAAAFSTSLRSWVCEGMPTRSPIPPPGRHRQFHPRLACDLAKDGIMVNALAPGFVDTPMSVLPDGSQHTIPTGSATSMSNTARIPLRRYGNPGDMAGRPVFPVLRTMRVT